MASGWEIVSMTDLTSITELAESKPMVLEFITNKTNDRKLNGDNYLQ